MVTDNHLEAIAEYIAYRYALRSQYSKNPVPNLVKPLPVPLIIPS